MAPLTDFRLQVPALCGHTHRFSIAIRMIAQLQEPSRILVSARNCAVFD